MAGHKQVLLYRTTDLHLMGVLSFQVQRLRLAFRPLQSTIYWMRDKHRANGQISLARDPDSGRVGSSCDRIPWVDRDREAAMPSPALPGSRGSRSWYLEASGINAGREGLR